ncbi:cysteine--1-D-myo-inosityl 2-amino-2-deoxy-alpha-D-glucopyranoside ligase [Marinitenerispora sediminis]|uniref:L-cysteine:1D-myo-inositol 2-amino-2-deoxy-alpha-D-glucopyranoside ligase n=1 Tax=Marinitenerispora sediminis TaxID=1931232 RepID=A0A368T9B8_9ACTN|nr:cysteine--1-D-myo-inosityl 2-amino-2-deoxy-alpha-D-glucopyranoside ligase [Marinitenerispora sediminis]RCV52425.1 cysteine--1-D-myo-inosityl 2-amino-2-deoxy-alpha-D-glucopyranoside ligase [Marinitenerispora sediminis]RCV60623.1 cysteine--1-D-myo-inosityl 2-amino-2-deoxy-alpha-D-glucopyranoside ligase [Marinitenerispora sediminis]RCV61096.1 cysteine--1-D-myo-inosityl 2-amino-2-deoxy-alpha-D-glucopyranoside ligase [Marinitenerispora sediminis]
MRSWPAPDIVRLPGNGQALRVHDTVSGTLRTTSPGPTARMYVCGITPYDAAHLGHAFTYLAFDLVNRVWRDAGHQVDYVQNTTDIDDPLLERAARDGVDWRALAEREIQVFRDDMAALRVLPPRAYVGVVESMDLIVEFIERIRSRGACYDLDGDVYFSAAAAPGFGSVSGLGREEMLRLFAERGGDPQRPGKKDPLDWLLWRAERPGEPAWDSPFGRGRPGWHVECSAISLHELGMGFDLNGGGDDLVFPHHEMGACEARCASATDGPQALAYAHVGMVGLDGEKMSKSLGNLVFVSGLRAEGADPMAVRLALLDHHYRSAWEWTADALPAAGERLARWRAAAALPAGPDATPLLARVRAALADDLDSPAALAAVDAWAAAALAAPEGGAAAPALVRDLVDTLLGVDLGRS